MQSPPQLQQQVQLQAQQQAAMMQVRYGIAKTVLPQLVAMNKIQTRVRAGKNANWRPPVLPRWSIWYLPA